MWQLRIPFPDTPELWEDWNWVYNKPEALANIDYKMRQWEKGEGGKKFKVQFGDLEIHHMKCMTYQMWEGIRD